MPKSDKDVDMSLLTPEARVLIESRLFQILSSCDPEQLKRISEHFQK